MPSIQQMTSSTTAVGSTNYYLGDMQRYWSHAIVSQGGVAMTNPDGTSIQIDTKKGIHPELYFTYIKKKFKLLEKRKLDERLKKLETAFDEAVENGQIKLGEKVLTDLSRELRESQIYAKGITKFIERDDLVRYKRKLRGGHISDTLLADFTRVIPKNIMAKKKAAEGVFDDFVIYHYWDDEAEKKRALKQRATPEEKSRMRDPVLFGIIRETDRLYFVGEWVDEHCDLTFDEMVDVICKGREKCKPQEIAKNPVI